MPGTREEKYNASLRVKTNPWVTFSSGPHHTDEQVLDDLLEFIYKQFCMDTGSSLEDLPNMMDYRDNQWERIGKIRASSKP